MLRFHAFILGFLLLELLNPIDAKCFDKKDCNSCGRSTQFFIDCRWCALTNACHAAGSVKNVCSRSHQITSSSQCYKVAEPPMRYSSSVAYKLAKFSSVAYAQPQNYGKATLQQAITRLVDSSYKIVKIITSDCDQLFDYANCAAVISMSTTDNQVVVAYKGSTSPKQIAEQVIEGYSMISFPATGGKVLKYTGRAHNSIYPCVKGIVQQLLVSNPSMKLAITGHSLGGALAQLTAASLLSERVVPRDRLIIYTFGGPRVGDRVFAFEYDRLVGDSWRVVRDDDPIPRVVPRVQVVTLQRFAYHTRREVLYPANTNISPSSPYTVCTQGNEDPSCSVRKLPCFKIDCFVKKHLGYFMTDLPEYFKGNLPTSGARAPSTVQGQCTIYTF